MRFLIIFTFLITNVSANDLSSFKNVVIHKVPKTYDNVFFLDKKDKKININDFKGNLLILNFWATWCEPCKEEMPSLQNLQNNSKFKNLKILPINIGQEDKNSIRKFFSDVNIDAFEIFYDSDVKLAKKFSLRGIPTSILINKDGYEFAKVIGSIDFEDPKFVNWLLNYD